MIEAILVVLTKAHPGRDDDLNDWYTNIHLRDALRFRGSIAAQRFKRAAEQITDLPADYDWRYLALYDVFDAERFSREHWENALTSRMMVTDAIDDRTLEDYHYYPLQFRDTDPETTHQGGVILEELNAAAGREAEFRKWYNDEYFPAAMARPGVHSGSYLVFRPYGQLVRTVPQHAYVGIFKIDEPATAKAWRDSPALRQSPLVDGKTIRVTLWDKLTPRITEDQVHHTSADALAAEERARIRMGDRVLKGGREKLASS